MSPKSGSGDAPDVEEPLGKRPGSAGRYSVASEPGQGGAVRIDSTRMAAVRPELVAPGAPAATPPSSPAIPAAQRPRLPLPSTRSLQAAVPAPSSSSARVAPPPAPSSSAARVAVPPAPPSSAARVAAPPSPPSSAARVSAPVGPAPAAAAPPAKASWLPPPPPPRRDSVLPSTPSTFPGFDEGSIAFAFDALMSEGTMGEAGTHTVDLAPVRELFAELAANHMRHVRDFMIDVKWGEATREWIEICIPAVRLAPPRRRAPRPHRARGRSRRLRRAAQGHGLRYRRARSRAPRRSDCSKPTTGSSARSRRRSRSIATGRSARRSSSSRCCLSVPDVRKVTIDKLHAAGLTSLQTLFAAKPDEIAQVAGIPESLAQSIVERFQAYRSELQNASPQDARAAERERLTVLTAQLLAQHNGYEEASSSWAPDAKTKKRELFRAPRGDAGSRSASSWRASARSTGSRASRRCRSRSASHSSPTTSKRRARSIAASDGATRRRSKRIADRSLSTVRARLG